MLLRPAIATDIPFLKAWDEKPHVISAGGGDDWYDWDTEVPRDEDWGEILIAEVDGRPVGVIELIDPVAEPTHYWGDVEKNLRALDIWIGEEGDLGKGLGTQMMHLAMKRCFDVPAVTAILIDPLEENLRAHRFYERVGFEFLERRRFGADDCKVYRLSRRRYDTLALKG